MMDYKTRAFEINTGKMFIEHKHPDVIATSAGVFKREVGHISGNMWMFKDRDDYILSAYVGVGDKLGQDVYLGDLVTSSIKDVYGDDSIGIITYIDGQVGIQCLSTIACDAYKKASTHEAWLFLIRGCWIVGNVFEDWDMLPDHALPYIKSLGYQENYSTTALA